MARNDGTPGTPRGTMGMEAWVLRKAVSAPYGLEKRKDEKLGGCKRAAPMGLRRPDAMGHRRGGEKVRLASQAEALSESMRSSEISLKGR